MLNFVTRFVLEVKQGSNIVCISEAHGDLKQLWDFQGDYTIRNKLGLVLDVGEAAEAGTPVFMSTKNEKWHQGFRIVPVSR
jgi:hypothetical protein